MAVDDPRFSRHPVDRLVREIVRSVRAATDEDVQQIRDHIAGAPFSSQILKAAGDVRGIEYQGRRVLPRDDALFIHLVQRVVREKQWAVGTTADEYVADLHAAARHDHARVCVYLRRGGHVAAIVAPNAVAASRLGTGALPWLFVAYSADRGRIVSGYQASRIGEILIPGDAQWLR